MSKKWQKFHRTMHLILGETLTIKIKKRRGKFGISCYTLATYSYFSTPIIKEVKNYHWDQTMGDYKLTKEKQQSIYLSAVISENFFGLHDITKFPTQSKLPSCRTLLTVNPVSSYLKEQNATEMLSNMLIKLDLFHFVFFFIISQIYVWT